MSEEKKDSAHRAFSPRRIAAITSITFTGLIRQKAFYVVLIFALILIGNSIFMARLSFQQEFQLLKDVSLGAISIFTSLLAIVATARLLSQDIEDRTIYTILAKPVPRFEYLAGKLAGVLLLLALSTLVMSAMFFAVLFLREQTLLNETVRQMAGAPREADCGNLTNVAELRFQQQSASRNRRHLREGLFARSVDSFRLDVRELKPLYHRRHGLRLFHRTSAGHGAGILVANKQRRLDDARISRIRCDFLSRSAVVQSRR